MLIAAPSFIATAKAATLRSLEAAAQINQSGDFTPGSRDSIVNASARRYRRSGVAPTNTSVGGGGGTIATSRRGGGGVAVSGISNLRKVNSSFASQRSEGGPMGGEALAPEIAEFCVSVSDNIFNFLIQSTCCYISFLTIKVDLKIDSVSVSSLPGLTLSC